MDSSATTDGDTTHCSLLSLPAELRNNIYSLVAVEGEINVTVENRAAANQPALLQVNHQIIEEASDIYYHESKFIWIIKSFDASDLIKWQGSGTRRASSKLFILCSGTPHWPSLLRWLERFYYAEVTGIRYLEQRGEDSSYALQTFVKEHLNTAVRMFAVVMKLKGQGLTWDHIKPVLEEVRQVAAAFSCEWDENNKPGWTLV